MLSSGSRDGHAGWSAGPPLWSRLKYLDKYWTIKFGKDSHVHLRMNCNPFVPITLPLVSSSGHYGCMAVRSATFVVVLEVNIQQRPYSPGFCPPLQDYWPLLRGRWWWGLNWARRSRRGSCAGWSFGSSDSCVKRDDWFCNMLACQDMMWWFKKNPIYKMEIKSLLIHINVTSKKTKTCYSWWSKQDKK